MRRNTRVRRETTFVLVMLCLVSLMLAGAVVWELWHG